MEVSINITINNDNEFKKQFQLSEDALAGLYHIHRINPITETAKQVVYEMLEEIEGSEPIKMILEDLNKEDIIKGITNE